MDFRTNRFITKDLAQERQGRASEVDNLQKQLSQSAAEAWLSCVAAGCGFTTFLIFLYLFVFLHPIPTSKDGCANGFVDLTRIWNKNRYAEPGKWKRWSGSFQRRLQMLG